MSSISDAFQKAEEETKKAEQLLAKWRGKDQQQSNDQIENQNKYDFENQQSYRRSQERSSINSNNQNLQNLQDRSKKNQRQRSSLVVNQQNSYKNDQRKDYLNGNSDLRQNLDPQVQQQNSHSLIENYNASTKINKTKKLQNGMFHNQTLQNNLKPTIDANEYGSFQSHDSKSQNYHDKSLNPQILNTSQYGSFQQQEQYKPTDNYDNNYSTVNSQKYPQNYLKHQTLHSNDYETNNNNENENSINIIKPQPIQVIDNYHHQKLNPVMHSISQNTNNQLNNQSKQQYSFNQNESILTQNFMLSRSPTNQSQFVNQSIQIGNNNRNDLSYNQDHLNSINMINIEKESEIIKLDKHYKQLLKSEKDEFERKLQKSQQQAQKEAEKKLRNQLNELRSKQEAQDNLELQLTKAKSQNDKLQKELEHQTKKRKKFESKCQRQEDQLKTVQKKLDDLWERQNLEKENAKLVTKYEIESESRKTINDLTMKIIELEKQLRDKDLECGSLKVQLDSAKNELYHEHSFNKYINKSQDNILECENQILKQQNKQIHDQLLVVENESKQNSLKLQETQQKEIQIQEKYESLKRKFAIIVKEKETLEANKFQETAKFKDLQHISNNSNQQANEKEQNKTIVNEECKRCEKWRCQMSDLSEKYFSMIKNMRNELEQLRIENRSCISNGQRDIHQTIIGKLRDYLEKIKEREQTKGFANVEKNIRKTPKPLVGERKSSVVVISKRKQSLQHHDNYKDISTLEENNQNFNHNTSFSQGNTTDRGVLQSRRYMNTLDNFPTQTSNSFQNRTYTHISSTLNHDNQQHQYLNQQQLKQKQKSQLLSAKLDQIQNTLLHKTIVKSTQRTKRGPPQNDQLQTLQINNHHKNNNNNVSQLTKQKTKKKRSKSMQGKKGDQQNNNKENCLRQESSNINNNNNGNTLQQQYFGKKKKSTAANNNNNTIDVNVVATMKYQNHNIISLRNKLNKF